MVSETCKKRLGSILLEQMEIVRQSQIAPQIFSLDLKGQMVEEMQAGQFLHMRVPDASKLLRRPISISEIDKERQIARVIYRTEGEGTKIFSKLPVGSRIDCMGPQGNGFNLCGLGKGDRVLIIGGGIGVPPLVQVAKELAQKGVAVISVLGFASKSAVILEEELAHYGQVLVTTDDGSYGRQGYVSTIVDELSGEFAAIYACGAPGMLKYVDQKFSEHPRAYISMESRMACGMGACYACVVHVANQDQAVNQRVCEDGPVFETGTIVV
ncbi:dihydroorotate dehydrogenase electron transfer subunit [Streptococcus massiliensis]|uniref:Dihydroorotate dehydrogenase B (NAD(+)), electron transfer subunit n=1 Tax=Streptococcus massiliensis TaxID=313439 RepID=A0A380KVX0_9STRE|nr:dihydroorotate dehydrogenase electron transfer subunit [Streptococcus massiliensis]SUN75835.1 dihydroorotate dehydrogenase electron transfer subunit [Streptococcus massiliensis]